MALKDLAGQRFGRLTVIKINKTVNSNGRKRHFWICKCDCGNEKAVNGDNLIFGSVQSCGCLQIENRFSHNKSRATEYNIWHSMFSNPTSPSISKEWITFDGFYKDMGDCPHDFELSRIDKNKGFGKNNCRWVPKLENRYFRRKINKKTTSKYKGIYFCKRSLRYVARITRDGNTTHIGSFINEEDAALEYNKKALELFGEFAVLNIIE